ncbi:MAG: B12-binding domain-containing protein, partial [Syntrophobacteraceae bacterium]
MDKTLSRLRDAVVLMNAEGARESAEEALEFGIPPVTAINDGLVAGMVIAGEKFKNHEYFVPEILACSKALYAGLDILKPLLTPGQIREKGDIV